MNIIRVSKMLSGRMMSVALKEWSAFAIRNLCENNVENQAHVQALHSQTESR